jgi:hypothetical protein
MFHGSSSNTSNCSFFPSKVKAIQCLAFQVFPMPDGYAKRTRAPVEIIEAEATF